MKNIAHKLRLSTSIIIFLLTVVSVIYLFLNPSFVVGLPLKKIAINVVLSMLIFFILFGRLGCSLVCPFGILQDIVTLFSDRMNEKRPNWIGKYIILAISVLLFAAAVVKYKAILSLNLPLILGVSAGVLFVIVGILSAFKDRLFCTHICPCGTFVGLISNISLFKLRIDKEKCMCCGICERGCPSCSVEACEEDIDNETCVKCLKCMSNCPKEAIGFKFLD
ncbi:MAG: 4Fe-4S binding protein [Candidatus Gastranaerophilales bacterium]|nr:4Fe-4S binding protein [Candidatus Gastranaerophilales bacterium]